MAWEPVRWESATKSITSEAIAQTLEIDTDRGRMRIEWRQITAGPGAGVTLVAIDGLRAGVTLVPTRGMGIWQARCGGVPFRWDSPVRGPIHPSLVPIWDPSGLGWLEGFDELLARCGLESNGAPDFDDRGRLRCPLHGRIANLPASDVRVEVDRQAGRVRASGTVRETRLFFARLELHSTLQLQADGETLEIEDEVRNLGDQPAEYQLLYHINVGSPVLGADARLVAPAAELSPRSPEAAAALDRWDTYQGPQPGFAEQVYLMRLQADERRWTQALLRSADGSTGLGVAFDTTTLPYFIQWKNTAGPRDGYVTGLEPATGFPNPRSFEAAQGRVVPLEVDGSITHRLQLHLLCGAERVAPFEQRCRSLAPADPQVHREPRADWAS